MALPITSGSTIWRNSIKTLENEKVGFGIINGLAITENSLGADMSIDYAIGYCVVDNTLVTVSSTGNVAIDASDGTEDRIDLISIDDAGTVSVTKGANYDPATEAVVPLTIPTDETLLAQVYVANTVTTITDSNITDQRLIIDPINDVANPYRVLTFTDMNTYQSNVDSDGKYYKIWTPFVLDNEDKKIFRVDYDVWVIQENSYDQRYINCNGVHHTIASTPDATWTNKTGTFDVMVEDEDINLSVFSASNRSSPDEYMGWKDMIFTIYYKDGLVDKLCYPTTYTEP